MKLLFFVFSFFYLSCQTVPQKVQGLKDSQTLDQVVAVKDQEKNNHLVLRESSQKSISLPTGQLLIEDRPEVQVWVRYFTGRGRDRMRLYLERSYRYLDLMRSTLKKEGLPEELVYVAMIESGFSSQARSRAAAVGYWQFIEATGRRYGLQIDGFVDERRDPLLSTRAAGEYLRDLYELFGTWYLAMASYNAGEYRVNRAMMRHYTRDFWHLRKKRSIPRETREYVPKFMAAHIIASNPKKYGFYNLDYKKPIQFESVAVSTPVSLKKMAESLKVDYKEFKALNPRYVTDYVPVQKNKQAILHVPLGYSGKMTRKIIAASFMARPKYSKTYVHYKVRWGDNLYKLALRNRTTVNTIARMNGFSSSKKLRAGQVIKLPRLYGGSSAKTSRQVASNKNTHKVKKGESLTVIARKYGVQPAQIRSWNNLKNSVIHPQQVLRVKKLSVQKGASRLHVVRRGETLISISKRYKVPLVSLMKHNSLSFKSILRVGRTLRIP